LQGFFDNINSLGKAYVFEFSDIDYISIAFSIMGFLDIVIANAFPKIGLWVYEFAGDFKTACFYWFIVSVIVASCFYVCFFVWNYSDNT
jgi:hypothetical protein